MSVHRVDIESEKTLTEPKSIDMLRNGHEVHSMDIGVVMSVSCPQFIRLAGAILGVGAVTKSTWSQDRPYPTKVIKTDLVARRAFQTSI